MLDCEVTRHGTKHHSWCEKHARVVVGHSRFQCLVELEPANEVVHDRHRPEEL